MTGATDFTRKAGLAGLLTAPLAGAALLTYGTIEDVSLARTFALAAGLAGIVFVLGLFVRHLGAWWARPVFFVYVLSVAIAVFLSPPLGMWGAAVAAALTLLGVLASGVLPRGAVALLLAGVVFDVVRLESIGAVVSVAGQLWLAWALWREPTARPRAGSVRESREPA